jgi:hypothetical protein
MVVLLAVAAPVTMHEWLGAIHGLFIISVVYKLWQWQT